MMFQDRTDPFQRNGVHVVDEEDDMRVAHADRHRPGPGAFRHVEAKRVGRTGQRNVAPVQPRRTHVHRYQPVGFRRGGQKPGDCLDHRFSDAGLFHQKVCYAAGGIAAGPGLAAVRVQDLHEGGSTLRPGRLDHDELVEADARAPVRDGTDLRFGQGQGSAAGIDDDEVVAEPVHLQKRDGHDARLYGDSPLKSMAAVHGPGKGCQDLSGYQLARTRPMKTPTSRLRLSDCFES